MRKGKNVYSHTKSSPIYGNQHYQSQRLVFGKKKICFLY